MDLYATYSSSRVAKYSPKSHRWAKSPILVIMIK